MDCRQFRRDHLDYLDDTLPGDVMRRAQLHVMQCAPCAAHDALIRRSLMAARSLPEMAPRADFQARMAARLATCARIPDGMLVDAGDPGKWSAGGARPRGWWRPATYLAAVMGMVAGGVWWQAASGASPGARTAGVAGATARVSSPRSSSWVSPRVASRVSRGPALVAEPVWGMQEAPLWVAPVGRGAEMPAGGPSLVRAAVRRPVAVADDLPVSFLPVGVRTGW